MAEKFYKMMKSDDESSTLLNDIGSYEVWKTSILEDKTGEYELRLRAEDTVLRRFSIQQSDEDIDSDVDFDSYNTDGFYDIIQRPDNTFEENYQKLTDSEKKKLRISIGITKTVFCMQQMKIIRDVSMEHPSII